MLILLKVVCVLGLIIQSSNAAEIPKTVFYSDAFLSGDLDDLDVYDNRRKSPESETNNFDQSIELYNQQQSNEQGFIPNFTQAESNSVASNTASPVSDQNSNEQGFIPNFTEAGSDTVVSNTESEQQNNVNVVDTATGTQPFIPSISSIPSIQETGTGGPSSTDSTVDTAPGTQSPNVQQETGTKGESPNTPGVVSTAAGTQPFYPSPAAIQPIEANILDIVTGTQNSAQELVTVTEQSNIVEEGQEETATELGVPFDINEAGTPSDQQPVLPLLTQGNEITARHPLRTVVPQKESGVEPISLLGDNSNPDDPLNQGGVEPLLETIPNSLRDALAQVGVDNTPDDPLVKQAKQYFMSIWNLEANRLEAPFLEVTEVWPEVGMVYMPIVNKMSSRIQNSRPVKEAAAKLKAIYEESQQNKDTSSKSDLPHSALTDFISVWGAIS